MADEPELDSRDYETEIQRALLAPWIREKTCEICKRKVKLLRMDEPFEGSMFCLAMMGVENGCKEGDCDTPATPGRLAKWYEWGKAKLLADQRDHVIKALREEIDLIESGGRQADPMVDGRKNNWKKRTAEREREERYGGSETD